MIVRDQSHNTSNVGSAFIVLPHFGHERFIGFHGETFLLLHSGHLNPIKSNSGKSSPYSRDFLDLLIQLDPKGMASAAQLKIDMLIEFAKILIELTKSKGIGPKGIELVKMDVSPKAYELIVDIVAGFDPTAIEIIKSDWL